MSGTAAAIREIVEFHEFFTSWLGSGNGSLTRAEAALAADFQMVDPSGHLLGRADVLTGLKSARGRFGPTFRIEIANIQAVAIDAAHVMAIYVERQLHGDAMTQRRSSALLKTDHRAPQGFVWVHLQETWISPTS
ncbi:MAG TPA: hypothetical protein VHL31_08470 [Geminicoccus sp.]|jgi:hypothetical protein|uniref:hypothetical protein n=1 Tax=Geminicoccus sp. TaxID=2024832 RepID=UPI002E313F61|nr:hypothetical protein [Geminicoccus sp.]HEX2526324.1 hypothetical protein [Geminicoccus sp.]